MAPPITITISGVNFKQIIVPGSGADYILSPFDAAGKPIEFMTIEVDSTNDSTNLYLPEIINFAGIYGTKINVIATTGSTNSIGIIRSGSDLIGSASSITLSNDGSNVVLTPVSATEWSAVVSA